MKKLAITVLFLVSIVITLPVFSADAVEDQYAANFTRLHRELSSNLTSLLYVMASKETTTKFEKLDLEYKGYISAETKQRDEKDIKEETVIKDEIKRLEKDIGNIKLDAAKYYHGKLPETLTIKWKATEAEYRKYMDVIYLPSMKKIKLMGE